MIGIIGAMQEELELLLDALAKAVTKQRGGFTLYFGTLAGRQVVLARCGIGKVNAAALAQLLVGEGATRVIFTGVAGALAPELEVGDLVISTDAVQHDVDVRALGYARGEVPGEALSWRADETLLRAALAAAGSLAEVRAVAGRVLSGDQFIADPERVRGLREAFGGLCAEMEGAAVAQVCSRAGVGFVIIRSISDRADGGAELDFRTFTPLAARRAKTVVLGMLEQL